ncbi:hypothetical protein [Virgibacillus profundi]|uniref:hypothetical protein n=1 Tax=Virgibacillus profundi TaxID=2024555 RepID=UPI0013FD42A8|nr:hypothetical protein [Virgibacillus profundi]
MKLKKLNIKKNQAKLMLNTEKNREYYYQKNEEQLQREKIALDYDVIRSFAR